MYIRSGGLRCTESDNENLEERLRISDLVCVVVFYLSGVGESVSNRRFLIKTVFWNYVSIGRHGCLYVRTFIRIPFEGLRKS
jgi:hypothetical protein